MQHDQTTDVSQHEGFARHPINGVEYEAEHLHEIADKGVSPATPAILVVGVLVVITPLVALLILLVFGVAHLS